MADFRWKPNGVSRGTGVVARTEGLAPWAEVAEWGRAV